MQVRIQNTIRFGEEMEIVDQYYRTNIYNPLNKYPPFAW